MTDFVKTPSGLILPEHIAERELATQRRPKAIDFFAGAGGMSLGFIQAGLEVVAAVEYDAAAVTTYMMNLCRWGEVKMHFVTDADRARMEKHLLKSYKKVNETSTGMALAGTGWISHEPRSTPGVSHVFVGDVRQLKSKTILDALEMEVGEIDCVAGGPPCQGFSKAGKQNVYDARNSLVFEFARFICELQPKTMVMEEVPEILNMVTPDGHPVMDQLCRILEDGNFGGFEGFRNAVAAQTGTVGLMRGKGTSKDRRKREQIEMPPTSTMTDPDQFSMFGETP